MVTVAGDGLPAGKSAELIWATVDGTYDLEASTENVTYTNRKYETRRVKLATADVDGNGRVSFTFEAPEDYGELHDLYVTVGGQDVAKGGFRLMRRVEMSPSSGPVGTDITIKVTGLGSRAYESTVALRYDNKYTGFISATTTRGTAIATIRASGPIGKHYISVDGASHTQPYLNMQQSPVDWLVPFKGVFEVTRDSTPPPARTDFPAADAAVSVSAPRTAVQGITPTPGASGTLSPASGPILAETRLTAEGLPPNTELQLRWTTAKGNRLSASGWELVQDSLSTVTTSSSGVIDTLVRTPEGLGGWHAVAVTQGETILLEVPFFVERSLVGVSPGTVRAGETFTIQMKGIGWTELDNGVAVTYDNAYIGYACGFNSNGDVTIELEATGGPGVHLIDVYPMIYDGGHGAFPWQYNMAHLSYATDHPSLGLGYRLPAFRLAIEVIP